ncbi:uncharacterized protein LOC141903533 isoform X2 [Tubulanus polymorphus]|uniref:uncharacterized protein LOC141903533 isoform X2 n=1 Tax=Tubulanus polymorphus TaxID=672921 RepID=UPI003DA1FD4A
MLPLRGISYVESVVIEAKKWKKKDVKLRGSNLSSIPPSLCQEPLITTMSKLDLSHNVLKQLPFCLWALVNLEHLTVTHNALQEVSSSIECLKKLKHLDVSHNEIKFIPASLIKLQLLQYLNFSGNLIGHLDELILYLPRLRKFFISKNPIANVPKDEFLGGLVALRRHFKIDVHVPSCDDNDANNAEYSFLDELRNLKLRVTPKKDKENEQPKQQQQQQHVSRVRRAFSFDGLPSKFTFNHHKPDDDLEFTKPKLEPMKAVVIDSGATDDTDSVYGDHGSIGDASDIDDSDSDLLNRSFLEICSDDSETDEIGECREFVTNSGTKRLKYKNVAVSIPAKNLSGYANDLFELDIVEDLSYAPDISDRATQASQVVSLEPHGTKFYQSQPAILDIPLAVPVDSGNEIICLCSDSGVGEPTDWCEMDRDCFVLKDDRVCIKTWHFSLFTVIVKKSYPVARRRIEADVGGALRVNEVEDVEVNFPRGSLVEDIDARIKVVYGDEPYCLDFSNDAPRALATPVVYLAPHGCRFRRDATVPVTLKLPIPDCLTIMNRLNLNPHNQITLWCSDTDETEPLQWERIHVDYRIAVGANGNYSLEMNVPHFSWYRAMWDCLASSLYECKIGVSYVYPYIQFSMMCQGMMDENVDSKSFGLEVICYRSDKRFPEVGNYRHRVGGSLRPRMVKPGAIVIRLKSEVFEADVENGEEQELRKVEFGFRGREFEKQFACVYKGNVKEKGVFGKVIVERMVQAGVMEPLFEFNLTKSGNEAETLLDSTDRWSLLAVKELASMLGINNDDNWKVFAKHLGFTAHEVNHKLGSTMDPFAFMLSIFQTRGGTPDEFVQALYEVGRNIRLNANGVKDDRSLDQIGFKIKDPPQKIDSSLEEDDLDESLSEVISRLGNNSTPKRKRSINRESPGPSAKRNRRQSVEDEQQPLSDNSFDEQSILENRQEISTSDMWRISEGLLQSWKSFGRSLNLPEEDLLCIQHANKDDTRECAYQMLLKFQERYPKKCKYGHIYRLLCENALSGVARKFCRGITPSERSVC